MRLADYVVTYSLQINNRCLRYLADVDVRGPSGLQADHDPKTLHSEPQPVYTESLLVRDGRRLGSMWHLMQPAWADGAAALDQHVASFTQAAEQLAEESAAKRMALRLAGVASDDDDAQALLRIARALPQQMAFSWEALNDLFADDSRAWRASDQFRYVSDDVLCQRIARSYRKGYRLGQSFEQGGSAQWLSEQGAVWYRWVLLTTHQMELLRPGLSDKGKAQLWYMSKLADTLRQHRGLKQLRSLISQLDLKKSIVRAGGQHVDQQVHKMDKRLARLAEGCFNLKPKKLSLMAEHAIQALGLDHVRKMQPVAGTEPPRVVSADQPANLGG